MQQQNLRTGAPIETITPLELVTKVGHECVVIGNQDLNTALRY